MVSLVRRLARLSIIAMVIMLAAAPTQASGQERLHEHVLQAESGITREELLVALRAGAAIKIWLSGPAATLLRYYVRPGRMV